MTPLEEFLANRKPRDFSNFVESLYRCLPAPLARMVERRLTPRHMRAVAARISFQPNAARGWTMRDGRKAIAESLPLDSLVGPLRRPVTIVATGPSARDFPWDTLRDGSRFIIAVNGAPTLLHAVGLTPDLLVAVDNRFARGAAAHFRHAPGVPLATIFRAASIMANVSREQITGRPFTLLERINSWYGLPQIPHERILGLNESSGSPFVFPDVPEPRYRVGWSHKPELGIFSASTVTFVALQLAVRLGARDIEIVGMDLSGGGRAYDEGANPRPTGLQGHYPYSILPSFEIMRRALAGSGVNLRNRSPVCPLPACLFGDL